MKISKINLFLTISSLLLLFIVSAILWILKYKLNIDKLPLYYVFIFSVFVILIMLSFYIFYIWMPINSILKSVKSLISWKWYTHIKMDRSDEIWSIAHFINQVMDRIQGLSWEITEWRRVVWEVNTAAEIQKSVLPTKVPNWIIWIDIIAKSKSSSEIWWDSFDIIEQWKNTLLYVWDVTGHWAPAALIMMMANTAISSFAENNLAPKEILTKVNKFLFTKVKTNHFMSAVMLRWDNEAQKLFYTWAGHETLIHFSNETWEVKNIKTWWIALKMIENISWMVNEKEIDFKEWDSLIVYSDWITEARNKFSERYWLNKLSEIVKKSWYSDGSDIFKTITDDLSSFVWNFPQEDDRTLIVIKNIWQYWSASKVEIWSSIWNSTWLNSVKWEWD